jgi:hypothetical protein
MTERLVDVINSSGAVLHTYPITLGDLDNAALTPNTKRRRWRRPHTAGWSPTLSLGA